MSVWLPRPPPSLVARRVLASNSRHGSLHPRLLTIYHLPLSSRRTESPLLPLRTFSTQQPVSSESNRNPSASTSRTETHPLPPAVPTAEPKNPHPPAPPSSKEVSTAQAPLSTRVWKKVKHEVQHYWHGSKLLVSEVRISARLQWKLLHGESLTRRERRQVSVSLCLGYIVFRCLRETDVVNLAEANDARFAPAHPLRCLRYSSLHGIATPCRTQTLPQHAALYIRGQVCCCKPMSACILLYLI